MAHHPITIQISSLGQVDQITLDEVATEILAPGTPEQSVTAMRKAIEQLIHGHINANAQQVKDDWAARHISVST